MVVGLGVEAAFTDGEEPGAKRVRVPVLGDVGGVNDLRQPNERRVVAERELLDQDLERAQPAAVGELGVRRVEGAASLSALASTWSHVYREFAHSLAAFAAV